jgi:lysophospholipase L1-like esterase
MLRNLRALLFCAFAAAGAFAQDQTIRIMLVGDSTVNDQGGWGPGLRASFGPAVEVVNLALNGRSSKSFRDEGAWAKAIAARPAYILIQFGHNDVAGKGPARETDPATTYRANLERYVEEARAASASSGARPVARATRLEIAAIRRHLAPRRTISLTGSDQMAVPPRSCQI